MLLVVGTAAAPAQASTPAAIWHMDEGTGGVMLDSTANHNDGQLSGTVAPGQSSSWSGTAYSFQGTPALVDVPDNDSLDPGAAPITVTVHASFTVPPATDYDLLRKGLTASGQSYKMEIVMANGQPRVLCLFDGSNGVVKKKSNYKTPPLADGTWRELKCVKTDGYVQVFVNGVSYGKNSLAAGSIANSDDILLGARTKLGGDQYQGLMDEVEIDVGA
jgi:hypothetical protein